MKKGQYIPEKGYMRIAVICFYLIIGALSIYVIYRYVLKLVLPFLIAWILSMLIYPLAVLISTKTRLPRKCVSALLVSAVVAVIGGSTFYIIQRVISELGKFVGTLGKNFDNINEVVEMTAEKIGGIIPLDVNGNMSKVMVNYISTVLKNSAEYLSSKIPTVIGKSASAIPDFFMFTAMLVIASYYISLDLPEINGMIKRKLPEKLVTSCRKIKVNAKNSCLRYVRAYLLMAIITFAELLTGFLVLGIDYAFTIALLSSLADMLPVIGLGVILLPWAAVRIIIGDYYVGIGLVVIYIVTAVIRQITEPKIIGRSIGLHPLVTLVSMYAGLRLMGIVGMLAFPVSVTVIKNISRNSFEDKNIEK